MSFWKWLDGKKSVIAAVAGVVLAWVQARGWVDDSTAMMLAGVLTAITGVAVGHKVAKGVSGAAEDGQ
jgi:uncharacterized membrane protein (DUF441 family)